VKPPILDMAMKIEQIKDHKIVNPNQPDHNRLWYETTSGYIPPDGFYFTNPDGSLRYGPFKRSVDAARAYKKWLSGVECP
jgi:hypothetical protein